MRGNLLPVQEPGAELQVQSEAPVLLPPHIYKLNPKTLTCVLEARSAILPLAHSACWKAGCVLTKVVSPICW